MRKVRLYVDDSDASRRVEQELQERGVEYTRIPESRTCRALPALETDRQVLVGSSDIRLYFLNGHE